MLISNETVHRISFGQRLEFPYFRSGKLDEYIRAFGAKPSPDRLGLPPDCYHTQPGLSGQLKGAYLQLLMQGIGADEGPFAGGKLLADLSADVFRGSTSLIGKIEMAIDRLRPFDDGPAEALLPRINRPGRYKFVFDPCIVAGSEIPSPLAILGRKTGPEGLPIVHPLEPYLLAAALLRAQGVMAYPCRAYTGSEDADDKYAPLIGIFSGEAEPSLATFRLIRAHPDVEWLEIWSDEAAMGALHAVRSASKANRLAAETVQEALEGRELSEDELSARMLSISSDLVRCYRMFRLPPEEENVLIPQSYMAIFSYVFHAETWKLMHEQCAPLGPAAGGPDYYLSTRGIEKAARQLPINPEHLGMLLSQDASILEIYPPLRAIIVNAWSGAAKSAQAFTELIESMVIDGIRG
ncbi:MAG TPA: hypothetical protein VLD37_07165, partial [Candidatus Bilamarchaeum sp.]|nr:hypothetical protein [Candidatus Bilamarchaeum sp.]